MAEYKIKNVLFFCFYLLLNPRLLVKFIRKGVYIPVYVQYEWLAQYNINTIIDVGAHKGLVAQSLHAIFPDAHIYAFEPNRLLHKDIASRVDSKLLTLIDTAVSNQVGISKFYKTEDSTLNTIVTLTKKNWREGVRVESTVENIPTTTLDNFFKNKLINKGILLKIDTEGAEGLVLKGATNILRSVSIIHIETYFSEIYKNQMLFDEIYDLLKLHGFKFMGDVGEAYFYPKFGLSSISNLIFINPNNL